MAEGKPKWYQKLFGFIPDAPPGNGLKSGAERDERSPEPDMAENLRREACRSLENELRKRLDETERGIGMMTSAYGGDGGAGVSERAFAALAMFAATDTEIALAAQKEALGDPADTIRFYRQEGFTEFQAKQLAADAISGVYTLDVLRGEEGVYKHFTPAMDGGRAKAAEALAAYPGDKTQLAQILAQAVRCAGTCAGVSDDPGVPALVKAAGETLSLMNEDGELKQLAKESFRRQEREFCRNTGFREKSFDELVNRIHNVEQFARLQDKDAEARVELLRARAEGKELSPEQKKACLRDILTAGLAEGMRREQNKATRQEAASPAGAAFNYQGLNEYCRKLGEKLDARGAILDEGKPIAAPALLQSAAGFRVMKPPAILKTVGDEGKLAEIRRTAEKIIDMDGLDRRPLDELIDQAAEAGGRNRYTPALVLKAAVRAETRGEEAQKDTSPKPESQPRREKQPGMEPTRNP